VCLCVVRQPSIFAGSCPSQPSPTPTTTQCPLCVGRSSLPPSGRPPVCTSLRLHVAQVGPRRVGGCACRGRLQWVCLLAATYLSSQLKVDDSLTCTHPDGDTVAPPFCGCIREAGTGNDPCARHHRALWLCEWSSTTCVRATQWCWSACLHCPAWFGCARVCVCVLTRMFSIRRQVGLPFHGAGVQQQHPAAAPKFCNQGGRHCARRQ
jgi:hypothetical protein